MNNRQSRTEYDVETMRKIVRKITKDNPKQEEICTSCLASSMYVPNCKTCIHVTKEDKYD